MSIASSLFRRSFLIVRSRGIETLEPRCLLSAAPATIPASVVGPAYSGTVHLHYHAAKGIHAHSAVAPVTLEFTSLSNGVLEGDISAGSAGQVGFAGPTKRRSFTGVFADGAISGTFNPRGPSVSGSIRETVDGELITGRYSAHIPTVSASTRRKHDQTTSTTSTASASSSTTSTISAGPSTIGPTKQSASIESISLPALETSFNSPYSLNSATTSDGVVTGNEAVSNALTNASQLPGSGINTTGVASPPTTGSGNQTYAFSTSSGVVSITNSGTTFTSSSGIVSVTAAPTYTPSSGIAPIGDSGI